MGDSNAPLVTPVVEPWGQTSAAEVRDLADRMTDLLVRVWHENNGRSIQQEAGIICQALGGCVFGGPFPVVLPAVATLLREVVTVVGVVVAVSQAVYALMKARLQEVGWLAT